MTREEHIEWCKERALELVDNGDLSGAVTSMISDLGKHPETAAEDFDVDAFAAAFCGMAIEEPEVVRNWINGYS